MVVAGVPEVVPERAASVAQPVVFVLEAAVVPAAALVSSAREQQQVPRPLL